VWEWVNDWYSSTYYQSSPSTNPQGPSSTLYRVLRGGSWADGSVRSSYRYDMAPSIVVIFNGFRAARTP
jgi:formylglycine-generating enzyme required for sulfatase activity